MCPSNMLCGLPLALLASRTSKRAIARPKAPSTKLSFSGCKTCSLQPTPPPLKTSEPVSAPTSASHRRMKPSWLLVLSNRPPSRDSMAVTGNEWPEKVATAQRIVAAEEGFQALTTPLASPEKTKCACGSAHRRTCTASLWPEPTPSMRRGTRHSFAPARAAEGPAVVGGNK